jgi:hypothetical protein
MLYVITVNGGKRRYIFTRFLCSPRNFIVKTVHLKMKLYVTYNIDVIHVRKFYVTFLFKEI